MFKILTLNKIAEEGLKLFPPDKYEVSASVQNPDAILVRSASLLDAEIPGSVLAIARAGAGFNNIPVERCSECGVVVFNTPGANANAVKELALSALLLSSRKIIDGVNWARSIADYGEAGAAVESAVEQGKAAFTGPEIKGKTLGVIGLGAIGVMVANDAVSLGMNVVGFDPYISVDAAWNLNRAVEHSETLEALLRKSDYVTIHIPFCESTKDMLNKETLRLMKRGARLINLARGGLALESDVIAALDEGIISSYIIDFPTEKLLRHKKVICFPHLGASTPEAEINCAEMAALTLINFLENGTIKNSVNYPACKLEPLCKPRLLVANKNIPNMIGQITTILAAEGNNIKGLINRHKGEYAFNIIDTEQRISAAALEKIKQISGVIRVRAAE